MDRKRLGGRFRGLYLLSSNLFGLQMVEEWRVNGLCVVVEEQRGE